MGWTEGLKFPNMYCVICLCLLGLGGCHGFLSLAIISSFMFLTAQGCLGLWSRALWWWMWAAPSLKPILDMREAWAEWRRNNATLHCNHILYCDLGGVLCYDAMQLYWDGGLRLELIWAAESKPHPPDQTSAHTPNKTTTQLEVYNIQHNTHFI